MKDWKKICLFEKDMIIDAMKVINETGARFALVLDNDGHLAGTLTDGDIRRAFLKGAKAEDLVTIAMNSNPIVASVNATNVELSSLMKSHEITHVPVVDDNKKLVRVLSLKDVQNTEPLKDNAIILMAGGLGSRLGELTANCPKPMLKLGDKPILEIIIENFREQGFYNFFLSVNYKSEMIESYFGDGSKFGIKINYIREKERMGTAGSLSLYEPINDLPIIIMNGDVLTKVNFSSLVEFHNVNKLDACMCTFRHDYQIPFGVVHFDGDLVLKIEEKPIHSSLVNAGIYSINPKLFSLIPRNTFFDMPVLLEKIIKEKYRVGTFQVQDYWLDIGRRDDFHRAENDYKNKLK
jgi:dTDP-glucose pyrophosphorylase